ncbi:Endonuclease Exonuclease phosphatase family RhoGAP domain [Trypanosoma vivax]|uniref:Inositol/phosphatidylinositol phosphatase, putative n=1 Tax=Trypanosoma vivax (strain Y486) TaxID=1055687 RepID=F9WR21_TRYVY|nr:putative inositol/phosphatidylinositol phosphatase [Trypanosoma vivax]KAH8611953.1 Endonuclease Exonuclease phosphatase family RhoGAP domain [Trypanosoma vivax]CCD20005.1 inositol/phosphatidylinositol phosphatase, putative [Trypanosoma vivax Y486]|eukprot:CCD20005.1 inositol/phosphatidylinositol phosphatase, putative [Trypanosoma vivax Y486]
MVAVLPPVFDVDSYQPKNAFADVCGRANAQGSGTNAAEESWVQRELEFYHDHYTEQRELTACVVTFNVACKKPPANLAALIQQRLKDADPSNNRSGTPVDLVMVSLQEIDMSASAMLKDGTEAATPWVTGLQAVLCADSQRDSNSPYFALPVRQLVGLLICVYVRRQLLPYVRDISIATVATGALGSVGNKGAVGLSLMIYNTSICLINAHLAAGQNNLAKRNGDAYKILTTMDFSAQKRQAQAGYESGKNSASSPVPAYPELLPYNHDLIIVAGDFNYRIDLSYNEALNLVSRRDIGGLLEHDEFGTEMKDPFSPWVGFMDLRPTFLPTYRFDIGTNTYDTSEKQRVPSYTDRIVLWLKKKHSGDLVRVENLLALEEVMSSDHKPVQALLRLPLLLEVTERRNAVRQSLLERLKSVGWDRMATAETTVSTTTLDFGVQRFYECGTRRVLVITNTGHCSVEVHIFRKVDGDMSEGSWLRVHSTTLFIRPNESREVLVETQLDLYSARCLKQWRPFGGCAELPLKSILVVCVNQGKMHFVQCTCIVKPSVFGNSLENISLLRNESCIAAYSSHGVQAPEHSMARSKVPKELWFLCEALYERGARQPRLFREKGSPRVCQEIMHHLDTCCIPLSPMCDAQSIAACLITFLRSLQEPVVPFAQYGAALAAGKAGHKAALQFVQQELPPLHANVWIYVCSLMNFFLRPPNATSNGLTPKFLSRILSEVMVVSPVTSQPALDSSEGARQTVTGELMPHCGMTSQVLGRQVQQERIFAMSLVECFLVPPPALMW